MSVKTVLRSSYDGFILRSSEPKILVAGAGRPDTLTILSGWEMTYAGAQYHPNMAHLYWNSLSNRYGAAGSYAGAVAIRTPDNNYDIVLNMSELRPDNVLAPTLWTGTLMLALTAPGVYNLRYQYRSSVVTIAQASPVGVYTEGAYTETGAYFSGSGVSCV